MEESTFDALISMGFDESIAVQAAYTHPNAEAAIAFCVNAVAERQKQQRVIEARRATAAKADAHLNLLSWNEKEVATLVSRLERASDLPRAAIAAVVGQSTLGDGLHNLITRQIAEFTGPVGVRLDEYLSGLVKVLPRGLVNLGGRKLGDAGVWQLCRYLRAVPLVSSTALTQVITLRLVSSDIGDAGAKYLADLLSDLGGHWFTDLAELHLQENSIGDRGAQALVKAVLAEHSLPGLKMVYLHNNAISDEKKAALRAEISGRGHLDCIKL